MFLEKPSFLPKYSLEEAEKKVSSLLKKKHWKNFSFSSAAHGPSAGHSHGSTFYVPYWFFSYDIYRQHEGSTEIISKGSNALNAFSNEFEEAISNLAFTEGLEKGNEIDEQNTQVLAARVGQDEAREIIAVRLASARHTSKGNVIISGLELLFVPIILIEVNANGNHISLRVNAATGDILNKDAVPTREKDLRELSQELLRELSTPQGWIKYSREVVDDISRSVSSSPKPKSARVQNLISIKFINNDTTILLLAAAAIIIVLVLAYVK
ncbi:MAG TPA: hypothetical protein VJG83_05500 [archaeon]|nr:hypothetical protein [archaeon]